MGRNWSRMKEEWTFKAATFAIERKIILITLHEFIAFVWKEKLVSEFFDHRKIERRKIS